MCVCARHNVYACSINSVHVNGRSTSVYTVLGARAPHTCYTTAVAHSRVRRRHGSGPRREGRLRGSEALLGRPAGQTSSEGSGELPVVRTRTRAPTTRGGAVPEPEIPAVTAVCLSRNSRARVRLQTIGVPEKRFFLSRGKIFFSMLFFPTRRHECPAQCRRRYAALNKSRRVRDKSQSVSAQFARTRATTTR